MRRFIAAAVLAASLSMPVSQARAIVFPGGTLDGQYVVAIAGVLTALFLPAVQEARREAALRGSITLGRRVVQDDFFPEQTLTPGGRAGVFAADILDFDLTLNIPTDAATGSADVRLTPETGAVEVINPGWFTDGQTLFIDASGLPAGTPIIQFTVDRFDAPIGFPDGRRVGDDVNDIVLAQLFSGSVNFGVAALPDGFGGDPALIGQAQLSPGDTFTFGQLDTTAVPLPATAPLLLAGLGALWTAGRRKRR